MTSQDQLEKLYELSLCEGTHTSEHESGAAYLEIRPTRDERGGTDFVSQNRFYVKIGAGNLLDDDQFKQWRAAHQAMLAAYAIEDYTCAMQDLKEAQDYSNGFLDQFYAVFKKSILFGLKGGYKATD